MNSLLPRLLVAVATVAASEPRAETNVAATPGLMPRVGDFTSMWWAEGFPGVVPGAPWRRRIHTGTYALELDTEAMRITHLAPAAAERSYVDFGRSPRPPWTNATPANLELVITAGGREFRCRRGGAWSARTGPRLIESGRFFQRADVTDLEFRDAEGGRLNVEARFETAAWSDRLGVVFAARPGTQAIQPGEASFGKRGGGFGLDGRNHLSVPHDPALDPETFTLALWVFVPVDHDASPRAAPWLVGKNSNEAANGNYGITVHRGVPHARLNIGGGRDGQFTAQAQRGDALRLETWNHLAMNYDGDTLRLFVNGREARARRIGRKRTPGNRPLVFGRRGDNSGDGYHFRGVVDEIRLYNRALDLREVRQDLAGRVSPRPDSRPVREWRFRADGMASETRPRETWSDASMRIVLSDGNGGPRLQRRWAPQAELRWSDWRQVSLAIDPVAFAAVAPTTEVRVAAAEIPDGSARPVDYDAVLGWHRVNLDGVQPIAPPGAKGPSNDAIERVKLVVTNPTSRERVARLVFEKTRRGFRQRLGTPITGISAVLRDRDGNPTGIPVQLGKNWHHDSPPSLYSGTWFRGVTQLRLRPASATELELTIAYGHWGGLPAASHAQLSLVGWGGNQLWHQAALGSWGESICFDPEQTQAQCTITDVRPMLVRAQPDEKPWGWTGNVGGGDVFRLFDPAGKRASHAAMRVTCLRQGPCLTEVTYAGRVGVGIRHRNTVSIARTDDVVRATYRLRMDVERAVDFSRFVVFQIGADTYNASRERRMAMGDETGLVKEWNTQWGGDTYRTEPLACTGRVCWVSLHEAELGDPASHDIRANRGLVIRSWNARLGGGAAKPWIAERGVGVRRTPASTLDILPPPGLRRLEPGDFVEATIEHIAMPQFAKDYYGTNEALRAALSERQDTWRMILREAVGNRREVVATVGTIEHLYPDIRVRAENDRAEFTIGHGLGFVPVTFAGLTSHRGHALWLDGEPLDQSIHGNDFWQTDYDPVAQRWIRTYNVPVEAGSTHTVRFGTVP